MQDEGRHQVESMIGKTAPALRRLLLLESASEPVLLTTAANARSTTLRKTEMQKHGSLSAMDPRDPATAEMLQLVEQEKEDAARGPFDSATALRKQMQSLNPRGLAKRQRLEREPPVETGESLRIGKAKSTGGVVSYSDQMRASQMSVTAGLGVMAKKLGLSLAEVLLLKRCQAQRKQKEEMLEAEAEMNALHRRKVKQQMQGDKVGAVEIEKRAEGEDEARGAFGGGPQVEQASKGSDDDESDAEGSRPQRHRPGPRGPIMSSKLTRRLAAHVEHTVTRHAPPDRRRTAAEKTGGLVLSSELANGSAFANGLIEDIQRQREGIIEVLPQEARGASRGAGGRTLGRGASFGADRGGMGSS